MKADVTSKIYKNAGFEMDQIGINKEVKAVIINFGDARGDIIVRNSNFGTDEEFADFTEGKAENGLHPLQIVMASIDAEALTGGRYIGPDDKEHLFSDLAQERLKTNRALRIRKMTKLTQAAFSKKYGIPKRSIENWESGKRECPEYVLDLLERVVKEDFA